MNKLLPLLAACLRALSVMAFGAPAPTPNTIEKMAAESDLIFKGTAISSEPRRDDWFKPEAHLDVYGTKFKVISIIKGAADEDIVQFRHYDTVPPGGEWLWRGVNRNPQILHFEPGQSYIIFAKKADKPGVWHQPWHSGNVLPLQGVLLCANSEPTLEKPVKAIFWNELMAMLKSKQEQNALYAIEYMKMMCRPDDEHWGTADFERKEINATLATILTQDMANLRRTALWAISEDHPYLSDSSAKYWLATVGSAELLWTVRTERKTIETGTESCWKELIAFADGKADAEERAEAIRALGLLREPALKDAISRWIRDAAPEVRASAALLLADFPGEETNQKLTALATDPSRNVRVCVAHAIGFAQNAKLANLLGKLLVKDKDGKVRGAAARSLLSFSPKDKTIAAIFRANLDNYDFKPMFLCALAAENPQPYLRDLSHTIVIKVGERKWWDERQPYQSAWNILFKYLKAQPPEQMRSGKFDQYLDAIEKIDFAWGYIDCDIYAFYLQRGMDKRAKTFREAATKAVSWDLDFHFKKVDQNPEAFAR